MHAEYRSRSYGPAMGHAHGLWLKALIFAALASLIVASASAQDRQSSIAQYRLLPGDEITVKMPLNPELDTTGPIGPDGRFSIPLAGRVAIGTLTLVEAEQVISEALRDAKVVANAKPAILVAKYAGVIYVAGEVRTPGPMPLTGPLNPLQAIMNAGGLLTTARSKKVVIIRQAASETRRIETINIRNIIKTGGADAPLTLAPGDVVFVPRSTIAEVGLFIDQFVNQIVPDALNLNINVGGFFEGNATTANRE